MLQHDRPEALINITHREFGIEIAQLAFQLFSMKRVLYQWLQLSTLCDGCLEVRQLP